MIPVKAQPEPSEFDELIRKPGQEHLNASPGIKPTSSYVRKKPLWRDVGEDLHEVYSEVCAYSCLRIALVTGSRTVDHFIPIKVDPQKAYEWNNYRLACGRLNSRKGVHQDILDPFELDDDVFVLDFPSLQVVPGIDLGTQMEADVWATINRLKLNNDGTLVSDRLQVVRDFCTGDISFNHLRKEAPFIAHELERQGLVNTIAKMMGYSPPAQATRSGAAVTDT